jgi:BirA family biotin operon repressor/biotin-[acetyl-CoA-carboxylase] ligase
LINIIYDKKNSTQIIPRSLYKYISSNNIINIQTFTQNQGIGRYNRKWYSPKGNLYFSLFFKNNVNSISNINTILCFLVHKFFKKNFKIVLEYKWPNDLYYQNKKIVGILTQNEITGINCIYRIGVGVNINTPISNKKINSITLREIIGKKINLLDFSNNIQTYIDKYLLKKQSKSKIVTYLNKYLLLNKTIYKVKIAKKMFKNIEIISLNDNLSLKIKINNLYENIFYGELD